MRVGIGTVSLFFFILISFFHASSFDLQVNDKDICHNAACFVPAECLGGTEQEFLTISDFFSSSCRFRLIIRAFTPSKLRVYIVFNGTSFALKYENEILFAVKKENDKVVATKGQYHTEIISQKIGADAVIAEFIVTSTQDDIFKSVPNRNVYKVFINDTQSQKSWSMGQTVVIFEINHKVSCDPSLIVNSSTTFKQTEPVHPYYRDLRCRDPRSQAVVYIDSSDNAHIGADIKCDWEAGKNFVYKVTTKTGFFEHTNDTFTAFCIMPCTQCTPVSLPSNCDDCTLPTFIKSSSPNTCSELKCAGNRFEIGGQPMVGEPKCVVTSKNEYKWSILGMTFDAARCFDDKKCGTLNPLDIGTCDNCDKINQEQDSITCEKGAQLRGSYDKEEWLNFKSIDCNKRTGKWRAVKKGVTLTEISNMTVQCYRTDEVMAETEAPLFNFHFPSFGIGIGTCLLVVIVVGLVIYAIFRFVKKTPIDKRKTDDTVTSKPPPIQQEEKSTSLSYDQTSIAPPTKKSGRRLEDSDARSYEELKNYHKTRNDQEKNGDRQRQKQKKKDKKEDARREMENSAAELKNYVKRSPPKRQPYTGYKPKDKAAELKKKQEQDDASAALIRNFKKTPTNVPRTTENLIPRNIANDEKKLKEDQKKEEDVTQMDDSKVGKKEDKDEEKTCKDM